MHKPEVAAAVYMYDDGGTEVFAAWEIVNQFTPENEQRWDPTEAAFVVTAHQEGMARVAARQWATGELPRCIPAELSGAVWGKVARATKVDTRQPVESLRVAKQVVSLPVTLMHRPKIVHGTVTLQRQHHTVPTVNPTKSILRLSSTSNRQTMVQCTPILRQCSSSESQTAVQRSVVPSMKLSSYKDSTLQQQSVSTALVLRSHCDHQSESAAVDSGAAQTVAEQAIADLFAVAAEISGAV